VRAQRVEQLFDNRDPAPFRERDLDPSLVEYLVDSAEDVAGDLAVVFWLEHEVDEHEIEHAFRAHFEAGLARLARSRRRNRRIGMVMVIVGIVLFSAAQLVGAAVPGGLGLGLREGLVIASWVVLWRPVELLIYGWIPARQERRVLERLAAASVFVRVEAPSLARDWLRAGA
jgi:hypothetical protein